MNIKKLGGMKKVLKFFGSVIFLMLILVGVLVMVSFLPIPGNYKMLSVRSGSMEPAIGTGSLVLIKPEKEYNIGDVITKKADELGTTITHRVISKTEEAGRIVFETKGDANGSPDQEKIYQEDIVGKVFLSVPYFGYLVGYAQTPYGLMVIVVIPAVIIVYEEIGKIKKELIRMRKNRKEKENSGENRKEERPVAEGRKIPVKLSEDESSDESHLSERSSSKKPKKLIW